MKSTFQSRNLWRSIIRMRIYIIIRESISGSKLVGLFSTSSCFILRMLVLRVSENFFTVMQHITHKKGMFLINTLKSKCGVFNLKSGVYLIQHHCRVHLYNLARPTYQRTSKMTYLGIKCNDTRAFTYRYLLMPWTPVAF